jgi:hypothetical protein
MRTLPASAHVQAALVRLGRISGKMYSISILPGARPLVGLAGLAGQ